MITFFLLLIIACNLVMFALFLFVCNRNDSQARLLDKYHNLVSLMHDYTCKLEDHLAESDAGVLEVKKLNPAAILPTVANPGEDLGYDIYSLEDIELKPGVQTKVRTGIVAYQDGHGLLLRDRSSMAAKGVVVTGGVVDAGYRGELVVILTNNRQPDLYLTELGRFTAPRINRYDETITIRKGDKIAQALPVPVLTGGVQEVEELPASQRGEKGWGSSGR